MNTINRYAASNGTKSTMKAKELSKRQSELLKLLKLGFTSRDCAKKMGITYNTVVTMRSVMRKKYDVANVASLVSATGQGDCASFENVKEFMVAFKQFIPNTVKLPDKATQRLRVRLIMEELNELERAWMDNDAAGYFDGLLDLSYVILGAAIASGINRKQWVEGFAEVHRSNMTKFWTAEQVKGIKDADALQPTHLGDRWIVKDSSGKVVKSPTYSKAKLSQILATK